jgi:hypothetical protein
MRREGIGIVEVLVALALGVALTTLGVRFLSGAGHGAIVSATGAENLGLANQLADTFRKRLGEYEVVDVKPGATSTQFTAIAAPPSWGQAGEVASVSGNNLIVRFPSRSSFLAFTVFLRLGDFAYLNLPQQKLLFATTVSGIDQNNLQVTFTLPPSCLPQGIQIAGSQVFVKRTITLDVRALSSPPFLSIQGGLRFAENALNIPNLQGSVSFGYVFLTQGGGQFTLTDLPSYPTTQVTQNGQTGFLSRIAISSRISRTGTQGTQQSAQQSTEGSALLSIPVRPAVTSCASPPTPGASSGFTVVVSGPDATFFPSVYSNAPSAQKVVVTIGGSPNVIPSVGTYNYQVPSGAGVDLRAAPLTGSENLPSGRSVSYTFTPDPPSATFPPGSLSPLFPNSASITYQLVTGSVRITLSNLPSGATWGVNASPTGGRYAQSASLLGQTSSQALLQLLPGSYNLSFPEVSLQRQVTISGNAVTYTALYPITPSPQSVVLSSGQTVDVSASVSSSPRAGTLTISRGPTNVPGTFEIYDAQGVLVRSVNIPSGQASASVSLAPGGYRIVARSVQVNGDWYDPAPREAVVGVSSLQTTQVNFTYTIRPSTLQINMRGLPEGQALIYVYRNGTQIATLQGSGTISITTPPGQLNTYTVSPQDVIYGGKYYQGTANPSSVQGKSGGYTYTVNVTYVPVTVLRIVFQNSTPCKNGSVRLLRNSSPVGTYSSDQTLRNVTPGNYSLSSASAPSSTYFDCVHDISPSSLSLGAGDMGTFTVTVRANRGALRVTLNGYPYSSLQNSSHLTVRNPSGATITPSSISPVSGGLQVVYRNLVPGTYSVSLSSFTDPSSGFQYVPSPASASPSIQAGQVTDLTVSYSIQTPPGAGGLELNVSCSSGLGCSSNYSSPYFSPIVCVFRGTVSQSMNSYLVACPTRATP